MYLGKDSLLSAGETFSHFKKPLLLIAGKTLPAMVLALVLASAGCGPSAGEIPRTRLYVIDYTVSPEKNNGPVLPVSVGVEKFRSDSVYRTDRIVYRKDPYRVDFYPYERWGAKPQEIVTDRVLDHLAAKNVFQEVVLATGGPRVDYLVRGRVKRFEEVSTENGFSALAQIEISVMDRKTGKVIFQRRLSHSSPSKSKPPQGFVNAMAENLRTLLGDMASQVSQAIRETHKNSVSRP